MLLALVVAEVGLRVGAALVLRTRDMGSSQGSSTILCIGDSWTLGAESGDWTRWSYPAQLQRLLDERLGTGRYRVVNRGGNGNSLAMAQNLPGWVAELRPALVLVLGGARAWFSKAWGRVGASLPGVPGEGLLDRLKIVQLVQRTLLQKQGTSAHGVRQEMEQAKRDLQQYIQMEARVPAPPLSSTGCADPQRMEEVNRARAGGAHDRLVQLAAGQPGCAGALVAAAESCLHRGDHACAQTHAERALGLEPTEPRAIMARAFSTQNRDGGGWGPSIPALHEAHRANPGPFAWALRDYLLSRLSGDIDFCGLVEFLSQIPERGPELDWLTRFEARVKAMVGEGTGQRIMRQLDGMLWRDFAAIQDAARKGGARVLLLNYPSRGTEPCRGRIMEVIRRYGATADVPVLELDQVLDKNREDIFGVGHPNAKGYGLVAEAVYRRLEELGWLQRATAGAAPARAP